ncbi:DUF3010 family protein [Thiomicrospira sp. ALE5]|uniref:DUF3010 family protein n=1 Tax=Thiomicrospira sp. ALE5 TaxID=748650 RepID=UPI0008E66E45|nr:DUF3010 family protein [Thiomicrospira sp. ALE5]SFR52832.1 Protein of unknown function [Thiomicrospira sp. ALE5]
MLVCGVDLSGNDAIVSLLKFEQGVFHLPACRTTRVSCTNPDSREALVYFQKTFAKLVEDYKVDQVVIRARMKKGKFAGGANGFILEGVLQVIPDIKVGLLTATEQKAAIKQYGMPMSFAETGLKKFQEPAFMTALGYVVGQLA